MSDNNYIIQAKNIAKYFGSVAALENVDFELKPHSSPMAVIV